jgi:hypothetical protein
VKNNSLTEYDEQVAIFQWRDYHIKKLPDLALLEGSMNGIKLPIGLAVKSKKQGMLRGMPDISLPVVRKHGDKTFYGLYIELKIGHNKPTPSQILMMKLLTEQNRLCTVCYGADSAISTIKNYLEQ